MKKVLIMSVMLAMCLVYFGWTVIHFIPSQHSSTSTRETVLLQDPALSSGATGNASMLAGPNIESASQQKGIYNNAYITHLCLSAALCTIFMVGSRRSLLQMRKERDYGLDLNAAYHKR